MTRPRHFVINRKKKGLGKVPLIGVVLIAVALLSLNLRETHRGTREPEVPAGLLGHWTTTDARYRDRGLILSRDTVVLETGPGEPDRRGRIESLYTWTEGVVPVLKIEYDAGDGLEGMEILWTGPDTMRLRNPREVIWTRAH